MRPAAYAAKPRKRNLRPESEGWKTTAKRVSGALRHQLLPASEIAATLPASIQAEFQTGTPLWYYGLYEANQQTGGQRLGAVGGRVVAEVILELLEDSPGSILGSGFTPDAELAATAGDPATFTLADLVMFAGVAGDEEVGAE